MINEKAIYSVKNRSASTVIYSIPEMNNLRREFRPGEIKSVTGSELIQLSYRPGGRRIIENYLLINNEEVLDGLNMEVEPEYKLDEAGVVKLLKDGSEDQLIDCLNFAPEGVKDLVKAVALAMPLNDLNKCKIIKDMLGYDVLFVRSTNEQIAKESGAEVAPAPAKKRRVASTSSATKQTTTTAKRKTRKVATPEYTE